MSHDVRDSHSEVDREQLSRKVIDMGDDPGVLAAGGAALAGTSNCPICGVSQPHEHTPEEIVRYRNARRSALGDDWDAFKTWADAHAPAHRPHPTMLWEAWCAARDHYAGRDRP